MNSKNLWWVLKWIIVDMIYRFMMNWIPCYNDETQGIAHRLFTLVWPMTLWELFHTMKAIDIFTHNNNDNDQSTNATGVDWEMNDSAPSGLCFYSEILFGGERLCQ